MLFVMAGVFAVAGGLATSLIGGRYGDAMLVGVFVGSVNNAILCTRCLTRAWSWRCPSSMRQETFWMRCG